MHTKNECVYSHRNLDLQINNKYLTADKPPPKANGKLKNRNMFVSLMKLLLKVFLFEVEQVE